MKGAENGEAGGAATAGLPAEAEVLEVPLLLPFWQARALEAVANQRGLTTGALARRLILDFLRQAAPPRT
jgi:hypothetical protein